MDAPLPSYREKPLDQCPIAVESDVIVLSDIMVPGGVISAGGGVAADSSFLAPQPNTAKAMVSASSATIAKAEDLLMKYTFTSSGSHRFGASLRRGPHSVAPNTQKHRSQAVSCPARQERSGGWCRFDAPRRSADSGDRGVHQA